MIGWEAECREVFLFPGATTVSQLVFKHRVISNSSQPAAWLRGSKRDPTDGLGFITGFLFLLENISFAGKVGQK